MRSTGKILGGRRRLSGRARTRQRQRRAAGIVVAAAIAAVAIAASTAYAGAATAGDLSGTDGLTQGNNRSESLWASLSADGRYAVFTSRADNLIRGDTPDLFSHLYVRDLNKGTTELIDLNSAGGKGNADSFGASISDDGRYVAFTSAATNLVPHDSSGDLDVFVRDRSEGKTERVSVASDGAQGDGMSFRATISRDGRMVAFTSRAANLVPDDTNGLTDVFVRDLAQRTTERVSVGLSGGQADDASNAPTPLNGGRYVAFSSAASNLVPGDTNGAFDVFLWDRKRKRTERLSVSSDGAQGNGDSSGRISPTADGRQVAFGSAASNLAAGDTNRAPDVFVRDRDTGVTERVNLGVGGSQSNNVSTTVSISPDGRFVGFASPASNLVPGDANGLWDVFLRDREAGTTERISVAGDGTEANGESIHSAISAAAAR